MIRTKLFAAVLVAPLLLGVAQPVAAQHGRNDQFYNGAYQGGRNGNYDRDRRHGYNNDYDRNRNRGGIGPGKGAAIGGAGGAAVGLLFGGGLKGAIIGGAAGAGVGAIAGKAHQDNRRRDEYGRSY